jgi:hypothetical protein
VAGSRTCVSVKAAAVAGNNSGYTSRLSPWQT